MIAAPVQCDVDGIPKGSHYAMLNPSQSSRHRRFCATSANSSLFELLKEAETPKAVVMEIIGHASELVSWN
jgi:hypothetical protein